LLTIRHEYAGLRSTNFYPSPWADWQTQFNSAGFGVDTARQVAIFHRWGSSNSGALQRFYVVLNFSDQPQQVRVPFPANGPWQDVLFNFDGSWTPIVNDFHLDLTVNSHWGHIFFREG
jgi:hypothetical protein